MIKWITDNIGTAAFDSISELPDNTIIVDVRDMVDKDGNSSDIILFKINEALQHLKIGKRVIICCDYGISRSNAIAIGLITKYKGIPFNDAVSFVIEQTKEYRIKLDLINSINDIIKESTDKSVLSIEKDTILVTGSSGFIGSSLSKYLSERFNVILHTSKDVDLLNEYVLLDGIIKENNIKFLVHLAHPRINTNTEAIGMTLTITKNVLELCKYNKLHLIYLSSQDIYSGYISASQLASENLEPNPKGTFGESKYLAETLIKQYIKNYGIDYTIIRSSPIFGGNNSKPKFVHNFINKAYHNQDIITHEYLNGFPFFNMLYISDLLSFFDLVLKSSTQGVFNIGSDEWLSTMDIADIIVSVLKSKSRISQIKINDYVANIKMDFSYAHNKIGWEPTIKFKEGINNLILGKNEFPI